MRIVILVAITMFFLTCSNEIETISSSERYYKLKYVSADLEITNLYKYDTYILLKVKNNGPDSVMIRDIGIGWREGKYKKGCINSGTADLSDTNFLYKNEIKEFVINGNYDDSSFFMIDYPNKISEKDESNNCI